MKEKIQHKDTSDYILEHLRRREETRNALSYEVYPALSPMARALILSCVSPATDTTNIEQIIKGDFGLSVNILRAANSAFYAFDKTSLFSIRQAITMLGLNTVAQVASDMPRITKKALFEQYGQGQYPNWVILGAKSIFSGMLSDMLIRHASWPDPDRIFFLSAFLEIGETFIAFAQEERYKAYRRLRWKKGGASIAQTEIFGFTFDDITIALMKKWNFSQCLENALWIKKAIYKGKVSITPTEPCIAVLIEGLIDCAGKSGMRAFRLQEKIRDSLKGIFNISNKQFGTALRDAITHLERYSAVYYEVVDSYGLLDNLLF